MSEFDGTHFEPPEHNPDEHGHLGDEHDPGQHDEQLPTEDWSSHPTDEPHFDDQPLVHDEASAAPHEPESPSYEEPAASDWSVEAQHEPAVGSVFDVHPETSLHESLPSTHDLGEAVREDHANAWSAATLNPAHVETDDANAALLADLTPHAGSSTIDELVPPQDWGALIEELGTHPADPLEADVVQQMLNALES